MHRQAVEFFSEFDTHDLVRLEWNDTNQSWANVTTRSCYYYNFDDERVDSEDHTRCMPTPCTFSSVHC